MRDRSGDGVKRLGFSKNSTIRFHPGTNILAIVPESQTQAHIPTPTLFHLDGPNTALEGAPVPNIFIDEEDRLNDMAPVE
eukprot:scaffold421280_cov72-Attheya_sp.AAC.4